MAKKVDRKWHPPMPPLPKFIDTALGRIKVEMKKRVEVEGKEVSAATRRAHRRIWISRDMPLVMQWQALFHEQMHMLLYDAGLHNKYEAADEEVLCDMFGTARALEVMHDFARRAKRKR